MDESYITNLHIISDRIGALTTGIAGIDLQLYSADARAII